MIRRMILTCLLILCASTEAYPQATTPPAKSKRAKAKRSPLAVKDQVAMKQATQDAIKVLASQRLVYNRQKPWTESGCSGLVQEMGATYDRAEEAATTMGSAREITFDHVADFHDALIPCIDYALNYQEKFNNNRTGAARAAIERMSNIDEDVLRAMRIGEKIIDPFDTQEAAALYVQGEFASMRLPYDTKKSYRDSGPGVKYSLANDNLESLLSGAESLSYKIIRGKNYVRPKLDELYKQMDVVMKLGERRRAVAMEPPNGDGIAAQEFTERIRRMVKVLREAEKKPASDIRIPKST